MTIASECKCGNTGGYCNGGEGCFFKPVSETITEIRAFSAERIQQHITGLESENTALKLEVESLKSDNKELNRKFSKVLKTAKSQALNNREKMESIVFIAIKALKKK